MTDRVSLVPISLEHIADFQNLVSTPDVSVPFGLPYPYPADSAEQLVQQRIRPHGNGEVYTFAIMHHDSFVGACSLHLQLPGASSAELAFWVGKPFWRKGFATKAVGKLIEFAYGELALSTLVACCLSENAPAINILKKHGFQFDYSAIDMNPQWPAPPVVKSFILRVDRKST